MWNSNTVPPYLSFVLSIHSYIAVSSTIDPVTCQTVFIIDIFYLFSLLVQGSQCKRKAQERGRPYWLNTLDRHTYTDTVQAYTRRQMHTGRANVWGDTPHKEERIERQEKQNKTVIRFASANCPTKEQHTIVMVSVHLLSDLESHGHQ